MRPSRAVPLFLLTLGAALLGGWLGAGPLGAPSPARAVAAAHLVPAPGGAGRQ